MRFNTEIDQIKFINFLVLMIRMFVCIFLIKRYNDLDQVIEPIALLLYKNSLLNLTFYNYQNQILIRCN